ncbi:MAG: DUF4160 domain-containing protein [Kiritimatiellae bacterium]|nr:DUF4160 domain-containing protein [Kiritimatiellia bacterium]
MHVHVRHGDGEAVFKVEIEIGLRESPGMKVKELKRAEQLAEEHRLFILEKWNEHINRQS